MAYIDHSIATGFGTVPGAAKENWSPIGPDANVLTTGGPTGQGCLEVDDDDDAWTWAPKVAAAGGGATSFLQFSFDGEESGSGGLHPSDRCWFIYNGAADICLSIRVASNGALVAYDSAGSEAGTSSPGVVTLSAGTLNTITIEAQIGSDSGTVKIHADNVNDVMSVTGVDMDLGNGGGCSGIKFLMPNSGGVSNAPGFGTYKVSAILLYDSTGGVMDSYVGDIGMVTQLPTADNGTQDWTSVGEANHWQAVDDPLNAISDEDSTYLTTSSAGDDVSFETADLDSGITGIVALVGRVEIKTSGGGAPPGTLTLAMKGGDDVISSNVGITAGTAYKVQSAVFYQDPGAVDWTNATANSARLMIRT